MTTGRINQISIVFRVCVFLKFFFFKNDNKTVK